MACVSHAILNEVGIDRLRKSSIDELITTDSVLRPAISGVKITTLSVAGLLGEAIKRIHSNSSVTSLFEFKGGRHHPERSAAHETYKNKTLNLKPYFPAPPPPPPRTKTAPP